MGAFSREKLGEANVGRELFNKIAIQIFQEVTAECAVVKFGVVVGWLLLLADGGMNNVPKV